MKGLFPGWLTHPWALGSFAPWEFLLYLQTEDLDICWVKGRHVAADAVDAKRPFKSWKSTYTQNVLEANYFSFQEDRVVPLVHSLAREGEK